MQLSQLRDQDLIVQTKKLVAAERDCLTKILHHLREIERRKLFCDFGCRSLFDYAVQELKYSNAQASRRIQAMRLLREIPEIETKIASGVLNLTNIANAQSYFREIEKSDDLESLNKDEKLDVLKLLENKSTREGEKELASLLPSPALPKERERILDETHSVVRFVVDSALKAKLEGVRSLLGPKGAAMSFAELITAMSDLSAKALEEKKFGKKRVTAAHSEELTQDNSLPAPDQTNPRYVSQKLRYDVWIRDQKKCKCCGSTTNLQVDHIKPFAKGGRTSVNNLRLLCFNCNQRAGVKEFGLERMHGYAH